MKTLEFDFRKGTLNDTFGNLCTISGNPKVIKSIKGNAVNITTNNYLTYPSAVLPTGAISVVVFAKLNPAHVIATGRAQVIGNQTGFGPFGMYLSPNAGSGKSIIYAGTNNFRYFNYVPDYNYHCYVFTLPGNAQTDMSSSGFYVDSVSQTQQSIDVSGAQSVRTGTIQMVCATASSDYNFAYMAVHDTVLTAQEINDYQVKFNRSFQLGKQNKFMKNVPTDLSKVGGLVAAYNMVQRNGKFVDITNNGYDVATTNTNVVQDNLGALFGGTKGTPNSVANVPLGQTFTVQFRCKGFGGAYNQIVSQPNPSMAGFSSATALQCWYNTSVGGKNFACPNMEKDFQNFQVTYDATNIWAWCNGISLGAAQAHGATRASDAQLALGSYNNGAAWNFNGIISDVRCYNKALTLQDAKDYHNLWCSTPTFIEDFNNNGADGVTINQPVGWTRESGTVKISEFNRKEGELVINGTFDSTVTSWSANGNHAIVWDGTDGHNKVGCMQITSSGVGSDSAKVSQGCTSFAGRKYSYVLWAKSVSGNTTLNMTFSGGLLSATQTCALTTSWQRFEYIYYGYALGTTVFTNMYLSDTGVCKVDDVSLTELDPLPSITKGTKYLEAVTTTEMSFPCQTAFGTFEFDLYKAGDADAIEIRPIASAYGANYINGYRFQFTATETMLIQKYTNSAPGSIGFTTIPNTYLTFATWYRVRIVRNNAGLFYCMIKGGTCPTTGSSAGVYTTVDGWYVPQYAAITELTFNSSNYFNIELPAGCRIANIKTYPGIYAY